MQNKRSYRYVLMTSAKNEESNISKTIESILSQSVLPMKWVIVNDGSSDKTGDIVRGYLHNDIIDLIEIGAHDHTSFASKAKALQLAYKRIKNIKSDFVGNLDADITLEPNYYELLIGKMNKHQLVGIAGGMIAELRNGKYEQIDHNINSVAGAVQLFRRQCYDDIGGYIAVKTGGIDAIAEVMARMKGWKVRTFRELSAYHHGIIGRNAGSIYRKYYSYGIRDYHIGYNLLFMTVKALVKLKKKPYIIGSMLTLVGYLGCHMRREQRLLSKEYLKYFENEQLSRLINFDR